MSSVWAFRNRGIKLEGTTVGAFGEFKVAEPHIYISQVFTRPIDPARECVYVGTISQQFNKTLLKVSGDAGGTSYFQTKRNIRYVSGQTVELDFTFGINRIPLASEYAIVGALNDGDGIYLGWIGESFYVGYRHSLYGDTVQEVDVSNLITIGNLSRFRITYGYLGTANISFELFSGTKFVHLHTFETDGKLAERTHIGETNLPMKVEVSSTDANFYAFNGSLAGMTYGIEKNTKPSFNDGWRTLAGLIATQSTAVVGYRIKTTLGGFPSSINVKLTNAEFTTDEDGIYRFNILAYPAGTLAGPWIPVNSYSVVEYNATLTTVPLGYTKIYSTVTTAAKKGTGTTSVNFDNLNLYGIPGDEFLITKECLSPGAGAGLTTWAISYDDLI
jgi:hypothetical protein